MSATRFEVRAGAYYDSVVLMQLQKALVALPGVEDAGVVMATPANKEVLQAAGFALDGISARADDLLIVVRAASDEEAARALKQVDALLKRRRSGDGVGAFRPKSLASAVQMADSAEWVLVSVPGRYAAGVAEQALDLGKHVFLYSDNVPLDDEVKLKHTARERGLLVMGPDCGTAIINGVGLGFANRVRRGPVGIVAASGTGLQAVASQVHNFGGGVSQAIGTGGRDLSDAVGGITALQGLRALAVDPDTEVIVLISKPPSPAVAARLLGAALALDKPVVVNFIGYAPPARRFGNLWFANGLSDAAQLAEEIRELEITHSPLSTLQSPISNPHSPILRALFSGGTLAYEATLGLQAFLSPLHSNTPVGNAVPLADPLRSHGHTIVDLGDDLFTQGRLHPMMDNDARIRRLRQEAADPAVGLILLDVVLGEGAHPDPAGELAPVVEEIRRSRQLETVVLVVGTDEDPQNRPKQIKQLRAAGAHVFTDPSVCFAAVARTLVHSPSTGPQSPFTTPLSAINVGLESFYDSLVAQGAEAIHVDWRPPAGGNEKMMALLARLKTGGQST